MINLTVSEIKRHIKLNSLIGNEIDDYTRDMSNLINYLNNNILHTKEFKIKRTIYYGVDLHNIKFKYTKYSSSTRNPKGGKLVILDKSIFDKLSMDFLLSADSILDIIKYWLYKRIRIEIKEISFHKNLARECLIKLDR